MSDEPSEGPTVRESHSQKWLKALTLAYLAATLIGELAGLIDRLVPRRYGMLIPYGGFALVFLAYRGPGLKGWVLVLLGWGVVAFATYRQLTC